MKTLGLFIHELWEATYLHQELCSFVRILSDVYHLQFEGDQGAAGTIIMCIQIF